MNHNTFNLILDVPYFLNDEIEFNKNYELFELENFISDITKKDNSIIFEKKYAFFELVNYVDKLETITSQLSNNFEVEINENFFGLNSIEKEDLIRYYLTSISEIIIQILNVNFDEVNFNDSNIDIENERHKKIEQLTNLFRKIIKTTIKDFYQFTVDRICHKAIKESIDLNRIVNNNHLTFGILNLGVYYESEKKSFLRKGTAESNFKLYFIKDIYFDLFVFLNTKFEAKTSSHIKHSCIYRNMIKDGYLDSDLKSEKYKRLVFANKYSPEFKFSLNTISDISEKATKNYNLLKTDFFKSNS